MWYMVLVVYISKRGGGVIIKFDYDGIRWEIVIGMEIRMKYNFEYFIYWLFWRVIGLFGFIFK